MPDLSDLFPDEAPTISPPTFQHEQEMWATIDAFEQRAWSPNNKGFATGFRMLDKALNGLQTGFHMIGGDSNIGKSSFIAHLEMNVATLNPDVYVISFSLDDPIHEKIPRVVAAANKVLINAVKSPNDYGHLPQMIQRRNEGIERLRRMVDSYKCYDANHGTDIDTIEDTIKRHIVALKAEGIDRRLCVFIDNFHDLTTTAPQAQGSDKAKYDHLAQRVSDMATLYDIPIVCSGEFRKLNGNRRPSMDDLRESVKIKYEAKSILLCYNEVGIKGEASSIYFERQGAPTKQPVFEIQCAKNKYGGFKGRIFYEFYPELAYFEEADVDASKRYNNLVYSNS